MPVWSVRGLVALSDRCKVPQLLGINQAQPDGMFAGAGRPVRVMRAGAIDPGAMLRPLPSLTDEETLV
jgi:hypothetical protein